MVGLEEIAPVVALFYFSEAVDRLRRERLGHLKVLLRKVEVATGVIGLERGFKVGATACVRNRWAAAANTALWGPRRTLGCTSDMAPGPASRGPPSTMLTKDAEWCGSL